MNANSSLDTSRSFVVSQFGYTKPAEITQMSRVGPAITISQQAGAGAHEIAERAAAILQKNDSTEAPPWQVFDRHLVKKALEEHHLPERLEKYMPEDRRSYVQDVADELFGVRPPSWILVPQVVETILNLVKAGRVILVGRGASAVAANLPGVFHLRLVASLPNRIKRVQNVHGFSTDEAVKYIRREDRGSHRYAHAHFRTSIEDDLLYHLVINTDRIPDEDAALLIAAEAQKCFERERH